MLQQIGSFNGFTHAFLHYRGSEVKYYDFPTSPAARVPDMISPISQMHSLETSAQNQVTWGERQHRRCPRLPTQSTAEGLQL